MTIVKIIEIASLIESVTINDHANFAKYNEDVVCAGISSIVFGTLNALDQYGLDNNLISIEDAKVVINVTNENDIQVIIKSMIIQLQTIQESYPDYIKIETT